jgi:hypothetical protein
MKLTLGQYKELDTLRKQAGGTGAHRSVKRIAKDAKRSDEAVRDLFCEAHLVSELGRLPRAELRHSYAATFIRDVRNVL